MSDSAVKGLDLGRRCHCCGDIGLMPMVTDEMWARVMGPAEYSCIECFEARLGCRLTMADLLPCAWTDTIIDMVERSKV